MSNRILAGAIATILGTLVAATGASAQDAIEEVYVTGSRIKRADIDGIGKVNVVTSDDFAKIGAVSIR